MENKLDGNAAAGILQEIFPFEMTLVQATCAGCGLTNAIGALAVYMHGMGTVIRCPACDSALIRVVHAQRGRYSLVTSPCSCIYDMIYSVTVPASKMYAGQIKQAHHSEPDISACSSWSDSKPGRIGSCRTSLRSRRVSKQVR